MRVLKICGNTWENASRDKRELSVYRELGAETLVLAKGESTDRGRIDCVDGFTVYRLSTRPLGLKVPKAINRIVSLFTWAAFAKRLKPDVISGHDLLPGLTISWITKIISSKKPLLIYDAHEYELGRTEGRKKSQLRMIAFWEKFLIKKCAFSIMVNDCIADEVQKTYHLKERPLVIRSTPNLWTVDETECERVRDTYLSEFADKEIDFIAMYHGVILPIRGIEKIMEAVAENKKTGLVILGNGEEKYLDSLKAWAKKLDLTDRVVFHEAVGISDLWKYVGAADVGMIAAPARIKNALYSLPNKFFENIQSGTPVICPNYPAMQELVDQYEVGLTCDPTDNHAMAAHIKIMRTDKEIYRRLRNNVLLAKRDLCWEKEKTRLIEEFCSITSSLNGNNAQ